MQVCINQIIGRVILKEKYRFADKNLIAEAIRDAENERLAIWRGKDSTEKIPPPPPPPPEEILKEGNAPPKLKS